MKVNSLLGPRAQEWVREAECPHCVPPAPASAVSLSPQSPATCGNRPAPLRAPGRLPEPLRRPSGAGGLILQTPCTVFLSPPSVYTKTGLSLFFFFFFCCLCNEKLSTRSLIKFYAHPTPVPKPLPKKRKKGDLNLELI